MTTSPVLLAVALGGGFLLCCGGERAAVDDAGDAIDVDAGNDGNDGNDGTDAGAVDDAGDVDAGHDADAGDADAGRAGDVDAGFADAGDVDAGDVDAGVADAGVDAGSDDLTPARDVCASGRVGAAENAGALADPALVETSGLATSWLNPGVLWAHNDSGDSARVFAVGEDGAARGRFALDGVDAVDIEDIDVALCPDAPDVCVWLADTGDNAHARSDAHLVVFAEPFVDDVGADPLAAVTVDGARTIPFSYEGGPVDVEGVAVSADGTRVFLLEKVDAARARVFALQAPFVDDGSMTARVVTTLNAPGLPIQFGRMITAADLHTTGTRLLVRVYTGIFEYRFTGPRDVGADIEDAVAGLGSTTATQLVFGPLSERQGEALAYDASGRGLFSVSEDANGAPGQMLHHFSCQP